MRFIIKSTLLLAMFSLFFAGCAKFENGPKFSFRTKKARVEGTWKIEKVTYAGNDQTALYQSLIEEWHIEKGGTYHIHGTASDDGTWELGEDGDDVFFTTNHPVAPTPAKQAYRILRLKNKEMWMKQTQPNGDVLQINLKQ